MPSQGQQSIQLQLPGETLEIHQVDIVPARPPHPLIADFPEFIESASDSCPSRQCRGPPAP